MQIPLRSSRTKAIRSEEGPTQNNDAKPGCSLSLFGRSAKTVPEFEAEFIVP
jgi:hypothetical protein